MERLAHCTIPTHSWSCHDLFYIKQYGNTFTRRKMSNKDIRVCARTLPRYYALTYHLSYVLLSTLLVTLAHRHNVLQTAGYVKQRREYGLMYFMRRATSLSHCRLNMHVGHACKTLSHECMLDDGANNVIGRLEKEQRTLFWKSQNCG